MVVLKKKTSSVNQGNRLVVVRIKAQELGCSDCTLNYVKKGPMQCFLCKFLKSTTIIDDQEAKASGSSKSSIASSNGYA
jgi:hypothetical protein